MFFFDPLYFVFILPGLALPMWASHRVKTTFDHYSRMRTMRGLTGAEAAAELLRAAGITDVRIVRSHGILSDHYNPVTKTLALSEPVYGSPSIAAVGMAAHEAGHAIQHARHYAPLWVRSALVPTASIGSSLGYVVIVVGLRRVLELPVRRPAVAHEDAVEAGAGHGRGLVEAPPVLDRVHDRLCGRKTHSHQRSPPTSSWFHRG